MKWTATILIFVLFSTGLCQNCIAEDSYLKTSCAEENGVQKTERRSVGSFDSVDIKGSFSFIITCSNNFVTEISCDSNLLPYIATEVRSQKLFIFTKKSICTTKGIKIFISAPDIRSLDASGSNEISLKNINNHRITVNLDGAGDLYLSGNTDEFEANLFGSNHLYAENLHSPKTRISISGSSDARVYAIDLLKIDISGVGGVIYYGNPKTILKDISGIGNIRAAE